MHHKQLCRDSATLIQCNVQEIQLGMLQRSAERERSGGYAVVKGRRPRFRRAGDIEAHTDTVHR